MSNRTGTRASNPPTPKRSGKMHQGESLNHLLNFHLPPRQAQPVPRRSRKYGTQHGVWNKERFVNAQYRFVMNPMGDYTVHFADPDIYFQWHDILQVIISRTSALAHAGITGGEAGQDEGLTTCPICLSPPAAPRMTKCGHVYCFPCILHLIHTSDNSKWVRCPICFDSINERQLKAVKWYDGAPPTEDELEAPPEAGSSSSALGAEQLDTPRPGSTMYMRLVQRPQITTLALPRSDTWPSDLLPPHQAPFHFLPDVYAFSKFMLATPAYLLDDLTRDLDQLTAERRTLAGMGDELGLVFVDSAEQKVRLQMEKASALETAYLRDAVEKALLSQTEIQDRASVVRQRQQAEEIQTAKPAALPDGSDVPDAFLATRQPAFVPRKGNPPAAARVPSSSPARNPRQRRNLNPPPPSTSTYYYYQAASGQPVFLHPLDIKVLHAHFEDYAAFPDRIAVRVEAAEAGTVNDDLRKRCKYLAHLPEGADVVFVEADLVGVVGADGVRAFDGALKSRRARRRDKERRDDNARVRAEARDRERRLGDGASAGSWTDDRVLAVPPPSERFAIRLEEFPAPDLAPELVTGTSAPGPTGAWGARSFASAAHAGVSTDVRLSDPPSQQRALEDEWGTAWDDLEQSITTGGGRKKRGTRMVVLGGGGGRRR